MGRAIGVALLLVIAALVPAQPTSAQISPVDGFVEVVAKGSPAAGVWPTMEVRVNGVLASPGLITVDSANFETYTVESDALTDTSTIDVTFTNDLWANPEDRNLHVQSVSINDTTIPSTDSTVVVDRGSGAAAFDNLDLLPGQQTLWWDASIRYVIEFAPEPPPTGADGTITVRALGTFADGAWPQLQVRVNGAIASPTIITVDTPSYADFTFTTSAMTEAPQVDVVFLNDGYEVNEPGTADNRDRNLYVDSTFVDERQISSTDPRVTTDWGWGAEAFDGINTEQGRYSLYYSGALRIDGTVTPTPPPIPARQPLAGELVYEEDFSAGTVDTENWQIYDGLGNAGWGLRRPSAFSVVDLTDGVGGKALKITANMGTGPDADQLVSGGMVLQTVPQTYGRYSMRVRTEKDPDRVTTGVGLLWPDADNPAPHNVWPTGGEIDWYEGWRDRLARTPIDLVGHYVIDGQADADEVNLRGPDGELVDGSEWHTYQLDWRPDYLAVSVDGGPPNILTDDPAKIPDWNMKMTVQLDAWQRLDNPGHQPTISQPVSMWVDWIKVESYPSLAG